MKQKIRLTESDLHRVIKESVDRILNEVGDTENGQRALGALTAAKFKGRKKGDWGEVAKKGSDERDKASNKAAKSGYSENEPWSSLKAWHKKRASMSDAYNDGYQKQMNEEINNDEYQVNVSETVDGQTVAWVSRYDSNGYVGKTTDTVYADGADTTDWCVYSGSKEECEDYAFRINNGPTKY